MLCLRLVLAELFAVLRRMDPCLCGLVISRSSGVRDLFPVLPSVVTPTTHGQFYSRNVRYISLYREYFSMLHNFPLDIGLILHVCFKYKNPATPFGARPTVFG
jgi:hypothetical protein